MAEQASYIGVTPRTIKASNAAAIGRGLRVTKDANGECAVAAIGVRGDFVTITDLEQNKHGLGCSMNDAACVPAVASEATNDGDDAYSAANGQFSKTAAGAVYCGKWRKGASGAGVIGEVELTNPK